MGSWAETTDIEKMKFALYAIKNAGRRHAMAFTLNLAPDVERRAKIDPDWLRRKIVLGVGSDVPLLIVFDAAPDTDRVHLHGAYAAANSDDANRIDCALDAAGGEWAAPRGDSYKLLPKVLGEESGTVDGWLVYLLKSITAAGQVVAGGPLWSMTNPARRAAKALHEDVRRAVNIASRESIHAR
jgi:hypothetical protein